MLGFVQGSYKIHSVNNFEQRKARSSQEQNCRILPPPSTCHGAIPNLITPRAQYAGNTAPRCDQGLIHAGRRTSMRQKPNFQNMGSEELMRQKRKSSSRLTKTGRKMGNGAPKTDCKETQRARVMKKEKGSGRLDGNPIERRSLRRRSALLKLQKNRGKVGKRRTELTQSINQSIKQCAAAGLLLTLLVLGLLPGRRVLLVREASSWCS